MNPEKTNNENEKKETAANPLLKILGNALNTSLKYDQAGAGLETKTCQNCGAARPADTNLQYCDYCQFKFY